MAANALNETWRYIQDEIYAWLRRNNNNGVLSSRRHDFSTLVIPHYTYECYVHMYVRTYKFDTIFIFNSLFFNVPLRIVYYCVKYVVHLTRPLLILKLTKRWGQVMSRGQFFYLEASYFMRARALMWWSLLSFHNPFCRYLRFEWIVECRPAT